MSIDLTFLPPSVRASARVDGWEVSWSIEDAPDAIDALARHRLVVLGLDGLGIDDDGGYDTETLAIFEPDPDAPREVNVAESRRVAHEALTRLGPEHPWVLITWE